MKSPIFLIGAAALLVAAGSAQAHPRLTGAYPADKAVVGSTNAIRLNFSERLIPKLSRVTLVAPNGHAVPSAPATVSPDSKQLSLKPAGRLAPGAYTINWTAVSVDTHRVQGKSHFTVK